jgi:hypothetical protein
MTDGGSVQPGHHRLVSMTARPSLLHQESGQNIAAFGFGELFQLKIKI